MGNTGGWMKDNKTHIRFRGKGGFTLIELLVVMVILGLLAALVGPTLFSKVGKGKTAAAKTQIELFGQALDSFRLDTGRYLKKGVPNDPWNRPYQYSSPGSHGDYDLFTYGLDGAQGGDGENKDISSWE